MRTRLLHTVPAAAPDANCDNGVARNDESYFPKPSKPLLTIAPVCVPAERPDTDTTNHDDYYLGGYAGI